MENHRGPTAAELLAIQELLRAESMGVQQTRAILPLLADDEVKAELTACMQTAQAHVRALAEYCRVHGFENAPV